MKTFELIIRDREADPKHYEYWIDCMYEEDVSKIVKICEETFKKYER